MGINVKGAIDLLAIIGVATETALAAVTAAHEAQALMRRVRDEGRDPTPEEIATIEGRITVLRQRLNLPLPGEES